jgi:hypothetical protein
MTPSVRARAEGEARQEGDRFISRRTMVGRDTHRRAVIGGAQNDGFMLADRR